jgi:GT2 family glycosyltransferase
VSGPEISVVLSTVGTNESLRRVLDGYELQTLTGERFELVLALDAAAPEPGRVAELIAGLPYPARIVRGARPGLSANRNAGTEAAGSPLVLYTDDDTIPAPDLLAEHLAWHRNHRQDFVGVVGLIRWAPELAVSTFMRWLDRGIQFDFPFIAGVEAGWGRFYGANVSVKRQFALVVGGFDETRLPYGYEDLDFGRRAHDRGLRLLYNRWAVVDHLREMTPEFWIKRARRVAVSEHTFVALHPDVEPYFHRIFSHVTTLPPASGRGRLLAPFVGPGVPWLGPRVWTSVDLYYKQMLAPHFLDEWERCERGEVAAAGPDLREHTA